MSNNPMNRNNNQQQAQDRVYYAKCALMRRPKDAPLEDCVFAVSGEVSYAEKKSGQYGDFVAITMTAVLPDKSVERAFGPDFVAPDHKVQFRFNLSGFQAQNFLEHTPRWGQDLIFMLYGMKTEQFQKRDGSTGRNISAKCSGFAALGSTKKADGTDRPAIKINGGDASPAPAQAQAQPAKAAPSVSDVMKDMGVNFEDDDDLPF